MKHARKLSLALAFGLVAATAGCAHSSWKADHVRALKAGSQIATTALGDVEYAVVGEGLPFLSMHGTPGGYDSTTTFRKYFPPASPMKTIAVSRPGYLRTPLSSGATFEQQADLFAALLDTLKIDRVVVVATSGGGYDGLQFALRHPERCIALVMISPSMSYEPMPKDGIKRNGLMLSLQDFAVWSLTGLLVHGVKGRDPNDPAQTAYLKHGLPMSLVPAAARFEGRRNDRLQRSDPKVDQWPLERITVPTLILHGDADENSDYQASVKAAGRIPNAKLVTVKGGDHFMSITQMKAVHGHIGDFVRAANTPKAEAPAR